MTQRTLPNKWLSLLAVLFLSLSLFSCQTPTPAALPDPTQPALEQVPPQAANSPGAAQPAGPSGDFDLRDPAAGLAALRAYRQEFKSMTGGESHQVVLRSVDGPDETVLVSYGDSSSSPLDLFFARLDGYRYSQSADAPCRAEPLDPAAAPDLNPAVRLPRVFGAQEAGREALNGIPAIHYTFDGRSVPQLAGAGSAAEGEMWIAEDGGVVLQYRLSVQAKTPGFSGTRSWEYTLTPLAEGTAVSLPGGCQPVLADLPALVGMADVTLRPGFLRFNAPTGRAEAAQFYYEQLTAGGVWQALPGSAPDQVDLASPLTVLSFSQPYGEGGRLLVLSLSEQDGLLQVIAQTARTQAPIQMDVPGQAPAAPAEEERADSEGGALPAGLPLYPGAAVLAQSEEFIMQQTGGSPEDVVDFYTQALQAAGATLDDQTAAGGVVMQSWSLEGVSFSLTVTSQAGATQIMIAVV